MIYPNSLKRGDIIKVISPSNGTKSNKLEQLDSAINVLTSLGYKVIEDKFTRVSFNGASANRELRVRELNNSFEDNSNALIAASGGDFINQIMNDADFEKYMNNIKWIQGHSDITLLLYYITTKYDVATIYNFNIRGYASECEEAVKYSLKALENKLMIEKPFTNWNIVNDFLGVSGRVVGGCLESIKDIMGTKFDCFEIFESKYKKDGIIWYFDVSEFSIEDVSRTMWQLKTKGYFKYCNCILFGRFDEKSYTGRTLNDVINEELSDLNIPIIFNCDLGHSSPVLTIINGALMEIIKNDDEFIIKYIMR